MTPMKALQMAAAAGLLAVAIFGLPGQSRPPAGPPAAPAAPVAAKARPIAEALAGATPAERAVWREVWRKAGASAGAAPPPAPTPGTVFISDSVKSMRVFLSAALDIGWRRIGGVEGGRFPKLKAAVESFLGDPEILGRDDVQMTDAIRAQWKAACEAVAAAGGDHG